MELQWRPNLNWSSLEQQVCCWALSSWIGKLPNLTSRDWVSPQPCFSECLYLNKSLSEPLPPCQWVIPESGYAWVGGSTYCECEHILGHLSKKEYLWNFGISCVVLYSHLTSELVIFFGPLECWIILGWTKYHIPLWYLSVYFMGTSVTLSQLSSLCKALC